jgi:hypothetical protein
MRFLTLAAAFLTTLGLAAVAAADVTISGQDKRQNFWFQITVPEPWNGDVLVYNHGLDFEPPGPVVDVGPLAPVALAQGFAIAASSYQQLGWAAFETERDVDRMLDILVDNFGAPTRVFVYGPSFGGLVTAQVIEELGTQWPIVGAYPFCGAMAGSRNWDLGIDSRLVYDAICATAPFGVGTIDGGTTGLPWPGHPMHKFFGFSLGGDIVTPSSACLGIPFNFGTPGIAERQIQFFTETALPPAGVFNALLFSTLGMSNLVWGVDDIPGLSNPEKLAGGSALDNFDVVYDTSSPVDINSTITRISANKVDRRLLRKRYTPEGLVGATKIVSVHTNNDPLVIVENQQVYQDLVPAANLTVAIVDESPFSTHCAGFSEAELVAGWESLRGWVDGAPQPTAASIQGTCQFLDGVGFDGPCRYDPAYVIPNMDIRVPPRGDPIL